MKSIFRMLRGQLVHADSVLLVQTLPSFCLADILDLAVFWYVDTFLDPFCPVKTGESPPVRRSRINGYWKSSLLFSEMEREAWLPSPKILFFAIDCRRERLSFELSELVVAFC